jgi:hypothetical protein
MIIRKRYQVLVGGMLAIGLLAGCGGTPEPTAAPTQPPQPQVATPVPATPVPTVAPVSDPGGLQPLNADECSDLANGMVQTLAIGVETTDVSIENSWSGQQGTGCQLTATGNGLDFENTMVAEDSMRAILEARGWLEDTQAPMCLGHGGWGPGASTSCYVQADRVCESFVFVEPLDDGLCSGDEPINACLDRLPPEQVVFNIVLTCAQGFQAVAVPPPEPLESDLMRIEFAAGAISAQVSGDVVANGIDHYVLGAMAGQEMTVNLDASVGGNPAPMSAILVIWGADGTVLISDHADATNWQGELPLTQDYYIDVKSMSNDTVVYTLEAIIPPATDPGSSEGPEVLPLDVPIGFEFLFGLGEPLMLPPDFPVEEGLPLVQPYVITAEPGEYEISLDFGPECQGAGACHYGSLAGKKVDSDVPVGTRNIPFEAERAQEVTLELGIQGYFVDYVCGANCSDALVFWIYDGYQYILGIKAGSQQDVLDLANATILNSLR